MADAVLVSIGITAMFLSLSTLGLSIGAVGMMAWEALSTILAPWPQPMRGRP